MFDKEQKQSTGDSGFNALAGNNLTVYNITINNNLSYEKAKRMLYNLKQNFYKLSGVAKETSTNRFNWFTDEFLSQLASQNPEGLNQIVDPDLQYDIFIAQREYARCGDPRLATILISLLIERTKETERSRLQIVLNESIAIVSKLTKEELDTLTALFVVEYHSKSHKSDNIPDFASYISTYILPFWSSIRNEGSVSAHLFYTGCVVHMFVGTVGLEEFLKTRYNGPFIESFFNLKTSIENKDPTIKPFFDQFDMSILNHMFLTTIGIAIGYANLCNITGEGFNLSKWL